MASVLGLNKIGILKVEPIIEVIYISNSVLPIDYIRLILTHQVPQGRLSLSEYHY